MGEVSHHNLVCRKNVDYTDIIWLHIPNTSYFPTPAKKRGNAERLPEGVS
jgi:hypothetical protein